MNLKMLQHLSLDALQREAVALGIEDSESHTREQLMTAIGTQSSKGAADKSMGENTSLRDKDKTWLRRAFGAARSALLGEPEKDARAVQPLIEPEEASGEAYEPIRTRTMAELLLSQGHATRALGILDELSASSPGDGALRVNLARARREVRALRLKDRSKEIGKEPGSFLRLLSEEGDVAVAWRVEAETQRWAQELLPGGKRTLRLFSVHQRPGLSIETRTVDLNAPSADGLLPVKSDGAAIIVASIGLLNEGEFVSMAHHSLQLTS